LIKGNNSAGAAAEAYVHYRLRSWGIDAHFAGGLGSPFDLWAAVGGNIIKVQVKSTTKPLSSGHYKFNTKKGHNGLYHPDDWDIMALVALPEERVWFTLRGTKTKGISLQPNCFEEDQEKSSWERALRGVQFNKERQNDR